MLIKRLNEIQIAITVSILLHLCIISYALAETEQHTQTIETPLTQTISVNLIPPAKAETIKSTKQKSHSKNKSKSNKPKKVKQSKIAQPLPEIHTQTTSPEPLQPIIQSESIPLHSPIQNIAYNEPVAPGQVVDTPIEQPKELTIIVGSQKLPLDQDMYLQSILDKIKRYGEFNYPKDAQGKRLKIKIEINTDGSAKTQILKTSDDETLDNKMIDIVQSASPFAKPIIIKQDKVIIIRTINFE